MTLVTRLDRHIGRTILFSTLLVLAVLLALFAFFSFIDALDDYGKGRFGLYQIVKYVVLSLPGWLYALFPVAALLGTILGLAWLALGSELTAMRAAGVSLARIVGAVMKTGLVFVLFGVLIGETVVPVSETWAQRGRAEALKIGLHRERTGLWLRDGASFLNIGEILPDQSLLRVNIYRFDDAAQLRTHTFAARARFEEPDGQGKDPECNWADWPYFNWLRQLLCQAAVLAGVRVSTTGDLQTPTWRLEQARHSWIDGNGVHSRLVDSDLWVSVLTPDVVDVFTVRPDALSSWHLYRYIEHLRRHNQATGRYQLVFWNKVLLPAATAVMVVLAVPFVVGQIRGGGMGQKALLGIMLGLGFIVLNRAFGHFSLLTGLPPFLAALLPIVLFLLLALHLLRRAA